MRDTNNPCNPSTKLKIQLVPGKSNLLDYIHIRETFHVSRDV